ncbi:hypothetical protein [Streptomyces sp. NPDC001820]|uniref:hypothetical protein n=1 Tax=Streptomyces sp. NPDC001820 TaxID=3364613 RepID=UPI0036A529CD
MDWLSPLSGLVGALVGAAASYLGTHNAQARALADARQARVDSTQDAAIAVLANVFAELHRHMRSVPEENRRQMDRQAREELAAAERAWDGQLRDLLGPVRIAIETLRDKGLRDRLQGVIGLLESWDDDLEYAYRSQRSWVLGGLVDHAVACVGAWQREEAMPEPNLAVQNAKKSAQLKDEEWQLTCEAADEYRREQAQREDNVGS